MSKAGTQLAKLEARTAESADKPITDAKLVDTIYACCINGPMAMEFCRSWGPRLFTGPADVLDRIRSVSTEADAIDTTRAVHDDLCRRLGWTPTDWRVRDDAGRSVSNHSGL